MVFDSLFIESLLDELLFCASLLVLWAASAGFAGVMACDINFGVLDELSSAFGVVLSD
jgi:hypothetical protein